MAAPSSQPMQLTPDRKLQLESFIHSRAELRKSGYILSPLSPSELERKKRCEKCCRILKKKERPRKGQEPEPTPTPVTGDGTSLAGAGQQSLNVTDGNAPAQIPKDTNNNVKIKNEHRNSKNAPLICRFHPGRVTNRSWTCCNNPTFSKPCTGIDHHSPYQYKPNELERNWLFYETPPVSLVTHASAIVLDCEMGSSRTGESELIRISVVDFFTGAVLLDSLVYPSVAMAHYNTRFSGVTRQAMEDARRRRRCILGRDAARRAVQRFAGPGTIVIGHAGHQDLTSLRWMHRQTIDTLIVETNRRRQEADRNSRNKEATTADEGALAEDKDEVEKHDEGEVKQEGGLSLKALALSRLGRHIQIKGRGHDSLEDALATRDLLCWHMANPMEEEGSGGFTL